MMIIMMKHTLPCRTSLKKKIAKQHMKKKGKKKKKKTTMKEERWIRCIHNSCLDCKKRTGKKEHGIQIEAAR